jgi:cytochrome c-type biogenesis protein CcmH/NrfG
MAAEGQVERATRARCNALRIIAAAAFAILAACASQHTRELSMPDQALAAREVNREEHLRALQQAEALYLSGRLKEAQAAFEQLTHTYPRNAEIWFRLGNTLMKEGDYDDAAIALQNAMSFDPGHGRAALNLALARIAQAQGSLEMARIRLASNSPERQQADELQRRIRTLLDAPTPGLSSQ